VFVHEIARGDSRLLQAASESTYGSTRRWTPSLMMRPGGARRVRSSIRDGPHSGKSASTWNDVFFKEDRQGDEWTETVISTWFCAGDRIVGGAKIAVYGDTNFLPVV